MAAGKYQSSPLLTPISSRHSPSKNECVKPSPPYPASGRPKRAISSASQTARHTPNETAARLRIVADRDVTWLLRVAVAVERRGRHANGATNRSDDFANTAIPAASPATMGWRLTDAQKATVTAAAWSVSDVSKAA